MSNENENSEDFASLLRISENQIGFIPAPQLAINNKRISICLLLIYISYFASLPDKGQIFTFKLYPYTFYFKKF